jgi:hypothetical protein
VLAIWEISRQNLSRPIPLVPDHTR